MQEAQGLEQIQRGPETEDGTAKTREQKETVRISVRLRGQRRDAGRQPDPPEDPGQDERGLPGGGAAVIRD